MSKWPLQPRLEAIAILGLTVVGTIGFIYSIKPLISKNKSTDDYKKTLLNLYYTFVILISLGFYLSLYFINHPNYFGYTEITIVSIGTLIAFIMPTILLAIMPSIFSK
jgi:hypothetical protein